MGADALRFVLRFLHSFLCFVRSTDNVRYEAGEVNLYYTD
jgi:hypothetical protein